MGEFARIVAGTAASILIAAAPGPAIAWGIDGHRLVATLAQARLDPRAAETAERLLAFDQESDLAGLSNWADQIRSPHTARWHYVNFGADDCRYVAERDCPDGQCVVAAIERQARVLASSAPPADRLKALRYVVHFVADIHQPLHASPVDDRGGNRFQVRWRGRATNLHAVWDHSLIAARPGEADGLMDTLLKRRSMPPTPSTPTQWAEESCRIVQAPGFYPASHKPGPSYAVQVDAILVERLDAAAWRLAQVLNASLGGGE